MSAKSFLLIAVFSLSVQDVMAQQNTQQDSTAPKARVEVVRSDGSTQEVDPRLVRKVERKLEQNIDHVEQTGDNKFTIYRKKNDQSKTQTKPAK